MPNERHDATFIKCDDNTVCNYYYWYDVHLFNFVFYTMHSARSKEGKKSINSQAQNNIILIFKWGWWRFPSLECFQFSVHFLDRKMENNGSWLFCCWPIIHTVLPHSYSFFVFHVYFMMNYAVADVIMCAHLSRRYIFNDFSFDLTLHCAEFSCDVWSSSVSHLFYFFNGVYEWQEFIYCMHLLDVIAGLWGHRGRAQGMGFFLPFVSSRLRFSPETRPADRTLLSLKSKKHKKPSQRNRYVSLFCSPRERVAISHVMCGHCRWWCIVHFCAGSKSTRSWLPSHLVELRL